jgi:hypothetical protein
MSVRYWLESELADIFGVTFVPSAQTADAIYHQISERLAPTSTGHVPSMSGTCSPPPTTRATCSSLRAVHPVWVSSG